MGRRFIVRGTNQGFVCAHCGADVPPLVNGSVRNHCPDCLHSLHVDVDPGDRASDCGGLLEPVAVERNPKKGWVVVHRCARCGATRRNKAADDDPERPDDFEALLTVARRASRH